MMQQAEPFPEALFCRSLRYIRIPDDMRHNLPRGLSD